MRQRLAWLIVAFALLVTGIESLKVLVAWWQQGRPAPGGDEILAGLALAVAGFAWWRHSVFTCRNKACLPEAKDHAEDSGSR